MGTCTSSQKIKKRKILTPTDRCNYEHRSANCKGRSLEGNPGTGERQQRLKPIDAWTEAVLSLEIKVHIL